MNNSFFIPLSELEIGSNKKQKNLMDKLNINRDDDYLEYKIRG